MPDNPPIQGRLWRQDDHGNEFPMALFIDRASADAECARYNALPHHQHYWVAQGLSPSGPA